MLRIYANNGSLKFVIGFVSAGQDQKARHLIAADSTSRAAKLAERSSRIPSIRHGSQAYDV
jgi:hypothetical protein